MDIRMGFLVKQTQMYIDLCTLKNFILVALHDLKLKWLGLEFTSIYINP